MTEAHLPAHSSPIRRSRKQNGIILRLRLRSGLL